jgi:hypothetical protein
MKHYKTDNLYVGLLGNVTSTNNDKQMTIESIDKYIIYTKLYYYYGDMAKDIFTGKVYYFWDGNISTSKTIEKAIGGCAVYTTSPIEIYLDFPKKKVSKSELLVILDKLNNPHKEEKMEIATEPITDSILKTILETSDLVKISNISNELKETTIKELEVLAESYVNDINSFNNKNELNPFDSEYQIRMTYIKALVDIEQKLSDPKKIKNYSLKRQLQTFKKELNQND